MAEQANLNVKKSPLEPEWPRDTPNPTDKDYKKPDATTQAIWKGSVHAGSQPAILIKDTAFELARAAKAEAVRLNNSTVPVGDRLAAALLEADSTDNKVVQLHRFVKMSIVPLAKRYPEEGRFLTSPWFKQRTLALNLLKEADSELTKVMNDAAAMDEGHEEEVAKRDEANEEYIRKAGLVDMSDLDALAIAAAAAASSEKPMIREIERIRKERQREADARAAAARKAVLRNEKLAEKNRLKRVFDRSKELAEYRRKVDARLREAEAVLREARVAAETEEKLTRFARIYADLVIKKYEEQEKAAGKGTADSADGGFTPLTGRMAQQRDKAIKGLETVMGACRSVVEFHARTQERIAAIAETKAAWAEGSKGKGKGKGKEGEEAEGPDDFGDEDFEDTAGFSANDALKMTHGCLNITKKALFCATMLAPAAGPLGLLIMPALAILTEAVDAVDKFLPDTLPADSRVFLKRLHGAFGTKRLPKAGGRTGAARPAAAAFKKKGVALPALPALAAPAAPADDDESDIFVSAKGAKSELGVFVLAAGLVAVTKSRVGVLVAPDEVDVGEAGKAPLFGPNCVQLRASEVSGGGQYMAKAGCCVPRMLPQFIVTAVWGVAAKDSLFTLPRAQLQGPVTKTAEMMVQAQAVISGDPGTGFFASCFGTQAPSCFKCCGPKMYSSQVRPLVTYGVRTAEFFVRRLPASGLIPEAYTGFCSLVRIQFRNDMPIDQLEAVVKAFQDVAPTEAERALMAAPPKMPQKPGPLPPAAPADEQLPPIPASTHMPIVTPTRFAYETIPGSKKKGDKADTNKYVLGMSLTTKDVSKKSAKEEDSSADE